MDTDIARIWIWIAPKVSTDDPCPCLSAIPEHKGRLLLVESEGKRGSHPTSCNSLVAGKENDVNTGRLERKKETPKAATRGKVPLGQDRGNPRVNFPVPGPLTLHTIPLSGRGAT
jgi:hypothetical protein